MYFFQVHLWEIYISTKVGTGRYLGEIMKLLSSLLFILSFSAYSLTTIGTGMSNKSLSVDLNKAEATQKAEETAVTLLQRRCALASGTLLNTYFIGGTVCSVTPGTQDLGRTCQAIAKGDCYDYDADRVSAEGSSNAGSAKNPKDLPLNARLEACREGFQRGFQKARELCVAQEGVSAVLDVDKDAKLIQCTNKCEKAGPGISPIKCSVTVSIQCGAEVN